MLKKVALLIEQWKTLNIIKLATSEELLELLRKVVMLCVCSDDLIDACCFLRKISQQIAPIRHFGVPLVWAPSYGGFDEQGALYMLRLMELGMQEKGTNVVILQFHAPCGMMRKYGHDPSELPGLAREVVEFITQHAQMPMEIHVLFHGRKEIDSEEQSTYYFNV